MSGPVIGLRRKAISSLHYVWASKTGRPQNLHGALTGMYSELALDLIVLLTESAFRKEWRGGSLKLGNANNLGVYRATIVSIHAYQGTLIQNQMHLVDYPLFRSWNSRL